MRAPPLVSLHLFQVSSTGVPRALVRMAADRRQLRDTPGLRFWKLLGTGSGRTFTLRDADLRCWGLLGVWDEPAALAAFERRSPVAAAWRAFATHRWRADLLPLRSRGRWAGVQPFQPSARPVAGSAVAAITRARLAPGRAGRFWRAVPPVSASLTGADGLLLALGIGESPVGLQGTFSLWSDERALTGYAYRGAAHRDVVARTPQEGWYREELFARFRVLQTTGELPALAGR